MEGQSVSHQVSQQLKIALYEALSSQQPQLLDTCADYLQRRINNGTQLLLLDEFFQNIQNIVNIPASINPHCLAILHLCNSTIALCLDKDAVVLTTVFPESPPQTQTFTVTLEHHEQFVFLSNSISFKHCHLLVAITNQGQFYLIIIKRSLRLSVSRLSNLGDINENKGILEWVFKKKERQYTHCNLHLFKIDKYERFVNLLVIRDGLVTVHLVELQLESNQSTILLVARQKDVQRKLQPWRVRQSFVVNQDCQAFRRVNVFLALEKHGSVSIFKLQVLNSLQNMFSLSVLLQNIASPSFKCLIAGDSLYYLNYSKGNKRYELFKNKISWLELRQNLRVIDEHPCMTFKRCPMLKVSNDQMIIISSQGISLVGREEEESDFSLEQRRWLAYKDTLNGIYQKKIQSLQLQDLASLSRMLLQKYSKLVGWIQEEHSHLKEQDTHVMEIFGVQIVGIVVLRTIADYYQSSQFHQQQALLSLFQLFQASACGQTSITIGLLTSLVQRGSQQLFLTLVKAVKKLGREPYYSFGVRTIFEEPFQILADGQYNQGSTCIFQAILSEIACFGVVEKKHLDILQNNPQAIKDIILQNHLNNFVIDCLLRWHLPLTGSDLSQYLRQLKLQSPSQLSNFVCQLLSAFRQRIHITSDIGLEIVSIFIQGLLNFHDELFFDIDRILPGLNILLLMKRGNRRKLLELLAINVYFQELKNKNFLYLLIEDILKQQSQLTEHMALLSEVFFKDTHFKESDNKAFKREARTISDQQCQEEAILYSLPHKRIKQ